MLLECNCSYVFQIPTSGGFLTEHLKLDLAEPRPLVPLQLHHCTPLLLLHLAPHLLAGYDWLRILLQPRGKAEVIVADLGLSSQRWLKHFWRQKRVLSQKQAAFCQAARLHRCLLHPPGLEYA